MFLSLILQLPDLMQQPSEQIRGQRTLAARRGLDQRDQRAARRFRTHLAEDDGPAGFRLEVEVDASFDDWAALSEGAYLLRSNITDWSDEQLWKAYIQLTQAEAAFRIHKDQLLVRPIWHQRADRVQAHILVCFLAFVLWKCLEMWQQRTGLGTSPRTVLDELARIQSHYVILHYGRNDHGIPMSEVEKVAAAFPDVPIHLYEAGHGFCRAGSADFHAPSCERAIERTLALFAAHGA